MKHNFPQVDLPVEMLAWRDVTEDILNLYRQSCRLKACIFALCTEGTITASINLMEHKIKKAGPESRRIKERHNEGTI